MSTKKATTPKTVTTVTNKFVKAVLAELNKTEAQKQQESVEEFVETAVIDCVTQIGLQENSELPKAEMQVRKAERDLVKAKKALVKARFSTSSSFDSYLSNREYALDQVEEAEQMLRDAKQAVSDVKAQITTLKDVLADFN
jgi:uncharacterized protein YbcI